jgi:hypothetical protein
LFNWERRTRGESTEDSGRFGEAESTVGSAEAGSEFGLQPQLGSHGAETINVCSDVPLLLALLVVQYPSHVIEY